MTNLCLAGVAFIVSLAASGTASAQRITYASQNDVNVNIVYSGLPASTQVFLLNQVSGVKSPALVPLLSGSGSLAVPIPSGPGHYYVLAGQGGEWVAQTVMFYTK